MLKMIALNCAIKLFVLLGLFYPKSELQAQNQADAIKGVWLVEDKDAKVKIYSCKDGYCGEIIWLEDPKNDEGKPKKDENNPDPKLRHRPLKGLNILSGLEYSGNKVWEDGEIYDPKKGKTYSCYVEIQENGKMEVRGYLGFSLIGRSQIWESVGNK